MLLDQNEMSATLVVIADAGSGVSCVPEFVCHPSSGPAKVLVPKSLKGWTLPDNLPHSSTDQAIDGPAGRHNKANLNLLRNLFGSG